MRDFNAAARAPASKDSSACAEPLLRDRPRGRAYRRSRHEVSAARMFAHVIETATPGLIVLLAVSLVIAGLVKGVIGVGMPIVAFPMLSMLVDVQTSVMLLSMPLVLSNIPQALEGGFVGKTLWSLAPVLVGMIPGTWIGVAVLLNVDPAVANIAAGASVILVAALNLLAPKLQIKQRMIGPVGLGAGFCGGLLGGIAALSGPLVFIFLLAKGLNGKAFTKEASHVSGGFIGRAGVSADFEPPV